MRRTSYKPYIFLTIFLLLTLGLPQAAADKVRSFTVATVVPSWRMFHFLKDAFFKITTIIPPGGFLTPPNISKELEILKQENHRLRSQVESLSQYLVSDQLLQQQIDRLKTFNVEEPYFSRRAGELFKLVELQGNSILGKVIFREPASWSSSLWINVGEKNNQLVGKKIVAKNSPVVVGTAVVGVVEYVGQKRSRVRLITDSGLVPSVRAIRGAEQNSLLNEQIQMLLTTLEARQDILNSREVLSLLKQLKSKLFQGGPTLYLAKGELYGSSEPLWRLRNSLLHGVGFNCDFADEEGPARNLYTGKPIDNLEGEARVELIKEGDLLITTGMDGVFPKGLQVAHVVTTHPLREGGCSFDLEAKTVVHLEDLTFVTVLPPVE